MHAADPLCNDLMTILGFAVARGMRTSQTTAAPFECGGPLVQCRSRWRFA
jgi:hypothetical protein